MCFVVLCVGLSWCVVSDVCDEQVHCGVHCCNLMLEHFKCIQCELCGVLHLIECWFLFIVRVHVLHVHVVVGPGLASMSPDCCMIVCMVRLYVMMLGVCVW